MITTFFTEDFQIKTLQPVATAAGTNSPCALASSSSVELDVAAFKAIQLFRDKSTETTLVTVQFSLDSADSDPVYEAGSISMDLAKGHAEFPLQGVRWVKITNEDSGSRDVSFLGLKVV